MKTLNSPPNSPKQSPSSRLRPAKWARRVSFVIPGAILLLSCALLVSPATAHAGFFSELFKLFTNADVGDRKTSLISETEAASNASPILSATPNPDVGSDSTLPDLDVIQESALVAPANPVGTLQDQVEQDQVFLYIVKPGDTPSSIAKSFSISVNTIVWANGLKNSSAIQIGDQLVILPISGVKYTVKKGDTIDSIAKKFSGDSNEISAFNGLAAGAALSAGDEVIIPDGELNSEAPPTPSAAKKFAALPNIVGYFMRPIQGGKKTQGVHGNNGVDLSNACSSPIFAAASGQVLLVKSTGWNGGFGEYTVMNHPNGTQTLYAHESKIMVASGEVVTQGQLIGLIGNTGNTRGATGCHVHFEIHGAKNPF